jgi:hypothetical protein
LSQAGETFLQPHQGLNVWCVHSIWEFFAITEGIVALAPIDSEWFTSVKDSPLMKEFL